jgi:hypothetical protein
VTKPTTAGTLLPKNLDTIDPLGRPFTLGDITQQASSDGRLADATAERPLHRPSAGGPTALTPEQIFRDGYVGPATVNLAVKAVSLGGGTFSMEEATERQIAQAADGKKYVSRFRIVVAEPVEARLRQLGVEDLQKHFYGKTVRVAGNVKQEIEASDGGRLVTYTLIVERLDQLQSVGKGTAGDDFPGMGGTGMIPGGMGMPSADHHSITLSGR